MRNAPPNEKAKTKNKFTKVLQEYMMKHTNLDKMFVVKNRVLAERGLDCEKGRIF